MQISIRLIPPKQRSDSTTASVTRPPALETVRISTPSPSAAMDTTVRNVAVCSIGATAMVGTDPIDQSFVRDLADDERGQALVQSMITLSHDLGYLVVAEGVETAAAAAILAD
ncbi:EAL domain-containing protein, partial [Campylobacter coli]|nr:EAL domain-containing protein [Campylobacter coli]